jgi:sphinganine-1-phosphate aldolase
MPRSTDTPVQVDVRQLARQVDGNTIALVGSAPDYCYGNYDPLPEIAALARSRGIGCHSDCCLGSFNNAFAEEAGHPLPHPVDFALPGVTSISCDPHKYAYGPKGFSVCMFRCAQHSVAPLN